MIFLGITGSFAAAVIYDKQQTKRQRQKWCDLVAPITEEKLPPGVLPRRITVYVEAPPADGLRTSREHFHEYVKPVLVAAAMDWDVVEGRREGDVRYKTAERIRKFRRTRGEGRVEEEEDEDKNDLIESFREQNGTPREAGPAGDLVIGRHTWKEYIRGLHEGWLGPVNKAEEVQEVQFSPQEALVEDKPGNTHIPGHPSLGDAAVNAAAGLATSPASPPSDDASPASTFSDDASPAAEPEEPKPEEAKKDEEDKPKRLTKPDPYISTIDYASAQLSSSINQEFAPAVAVPMPHILGFWNFPFRIWRFLNRRHLADDIGRQTAALILASSRPFDSISEQKSALASEEPEWHKSIRKREKVEGEESVWQDDIVFDERIAERMRLFELTRTDEERAEQLFREPRTKKDDKDDEE